MLPEMREAVRRIKWSVYRTGSAAIVRAEVFAFGNRYGVSHMIDNLLIPEQANGNWLYVRKELLEMYGVLFDALNEKASGCGCEQ